MGNVIDSKYSFCMPNSAEAKMKRTRTTSADDGEREGEDQGRNSIENKFGLTFGFKNSLKFHFDSVTHTLHYPFLNFSLVHV